MKKFIRFEFNGMSDTGKTKRWLVITTYEPPTILGTIFWFARWRCYGFEPKPDTIYERQCLRDIADFVDEQTTAHRSRPKPPYREVHEPLAGKFHEPC